MAISLQDQLKSSGLIDEKKAKQLNRSKRKQEKQSRQSKKPVLDQHKQDLQRKKSEQVAKDRHLNQQKNALAQRKAISAQIKQLIEMNAIDQAGEQKYSFADAGKVKHVWVGSQQVDQLSRGMIAIAWQGGKYVLLPLAIADKIAQRDATVIVFKAEKTEALAEDDLYADYQIPDDLSW